MAANDVNSSRVRCMRQNVGHEKRLAYDCKRDRNNGGLQLLPCSIHPLLLLLVARLLPMPRTILSMIGLLAGSGYYSRVEEHGTPDPEVLPLGRASIPFPRLLSRPSHARP